MRRRPPANRAQLLEYDHVPAYTETRRTLVDELTLRCAPCHRRRHAPAIMNRSALTSHQEKADWRT